MTEQHRDGKADTPTGRILSVGNFKHMQGVNTEVVMATDDTQYSYAIARGGTGFVLWLDDPAIVYRWSFTAGEVATPGGGTAAVAGYYVKVDGPSVGQTIYFAHTAGVSRSMNVAGEVPEASP